MRPLGASAKTSSLPTYRRPIRFGGVSLKQFEVLPKQHRKREDE